MSNLKETLYKNLPTLSLEDFFGYLNEIHGGYIKPNYHPEDDNLVVLNYTELTTFEKRWNKYTISARGLILDLTNIKNSGIIKILAKPFDKFFNYGENEKYEEDIDLAQIESVMEKMDGSLGISYFFNGEIHFATRGSFVSEQAMKATEIWKDKYEKYENINFYINHPLTYLVEIIYPNNRIVVDYGDKEELIMLGTTFLHNDAPLQESYYRDTEWEAVRLHMKMAPQRFESLSEMLEMKSSISSNEEGWVIKFKNGKRLKIKGDEYINVYRVMYGLSDKAKVKAWSENNIDELLLNIPEEFREEIEKLKNSLDKQVNSIYNILTLLFNSIYETHNDKKDFAIFVNKSIAKEYRGFMFAAYKEGDISIDKIKEFIFKNYRHYLEVIK